MRSTTLLLWITTLLAVATANTGFLEEYRSNFAALSREVEFELQQKRSRNGNLIHEFNRELILELGLMIPRMRQVVQETELYIRNFQGVDEECRDFTTLLFELYITIQETDIQTCALHAYNDVHYDALNRFLPYERTFADENFRSISQTVQTLGRNNVLDLDGIENELAEELDYYETLRVSFGQLLDEELSKHGEAAYVTINEFESCRDLCFAWQDDDMEYIKSYLTDNCD